RPAGSAAPGPRAATRTARPPPAATRAAARAATPAPPGRAPATRRRARGTTPPTRAQRRRRASGRRRPALPDPLDLLPRPRVHDVCLRQPRAARLTDPELDVGLRAELVPVRVDDELQPGLARRASVHVAQVEPVRLRVQLQERLRLECLLDHALHVDVDGPALVQLASGEMPDAVDVRVL